MIGHDNSGLGPGWHLDRVEIEDTTANPPVTVVFPCGRWLDSTKDPASTTQNLLPLGADGAKNPLIKYTVKVCACMGASGGGGAY